MNCPNQSPLPSAADKVSGTVANVPIGSAPKAISELSVSAVGFPPLERAAPKIGCFLAANLISLENMRKLWAGAFVLTLLGASPVCDGASALEQWTYRTGAWPTDSSFNSVAYGAGRFVAVSQYFPGSIIVTSENGSGWTQVASPPVPSLTKLTYVHDRFIAHGNPELMLVSSNGLDWTSQVLSNSDGVSFWGAGYGDGRWVVAATKAVGGNDYHAVLWSSTNFTNWSVWESTNNAYCRGVAYGNGRFMAVGGLVGMDPTNRILISTDGQTWTPRGCPLGDILDVVFGQGKFVAVCSSASNRILTSADGETWTGHRAIDERVYISKLRFANGTFIAVGSSNQSQHTIVCSVDGTNWMTQLIGPRIGNYFLNDAAYGAGTFVGVGMPAAIVQSGNVAIPRFDRIELLSGDGIVLNIQGEIGRAYRLERSTNLSNWEKVSDYTNDLPLSRVHDPSGGASPLRFYRSSVR